VNHHLPLSITFLGTGTSSGVPMVGCDCRVCQSPHAKDKRLRSSILVQSATTTVVVDATPDFRQQMLSHGVKQLDAILITHAHKDHVGGLDDTRGFQYIQQRATPLYGSSSALAGVRREVPYAFEDQKYPGVPVYDLHEISDACFVVGDIEIMPILVWHYHLPVHGFRFGPFTYITDANSIPEESMQKLEGTQILVLNALRKEPHISHFTLGEAVTLAQQLQVKQAWFTHISHQLGMHHEINEELPPGIQLAYDGLQLTIE
jgi:phosphoribosyl 1,2-cyclic phosphate phosphodiesterase